MLIKGIYLVAFAAIVGCSSAGGSATAGTPAPRTGVYLSAEEMAKAHADVMTAFDAISRLRPNWLVSHGSFASVYVDGQPYGDLSSLRNLPAYHVSEIRYYDVTQAAANFGIRAGDGGVIDVRMRTK